jgi:hypothetical protein
MTEQDQHAVIGKLVSERSEATRQVNLLVAEAQGVGRRLAELGRALQENPQSVSFDGEPLPVTLERIGFSSKDIDLSRLPNICREIRTHLDTIQRTATNLENAGIGSL